MKFNTIEEAELQISQYFKDNNQPVRMESRTSFEQYNKKTKDEAHKILDQPDKNTYAMRWVCKLSESTYADNR